MTPQSSFSRRQFLATSTLAGAAVVLAPRAEAATAPRFPVITFTKPFQNIGYDRTAEVVAEVGWSGIECPVRKKGQIEPEQVDEELPKLHTALQKRGLNLGLITTDIREASPLTEKVLRAAAALGVKRYRLSYFHYDLARPLPPQLAEIKPRLRELAALNKQLGLQGGIQNHSGPKYVGAPLWDLYELLHDIDPAHLGVCFDIGHATVEGGTSWPIQAKLIEPLLTCVYVKDFAWEKTDKGWRTRWGPLGAGLVRREFFDWLKASSYQGPISQHCEYLEGAGPEPLAQMKRDWAVLQSWL